MLSLSNGLNGLFGIDNPYVFPIIGLNLIVFSVLVWYVAKKHSENKMLVNLICGLDAAWVIGSVAIILLGLFKLSSQGYAIIGIVAIWIAFLGIKQFQYNR